MLGSARAAGDQVSAYARPADHRVVAIEALERVVAAHAVEFVGDDIAGAAVVAAPARDTRAALSRKGGGAKRDLAGLSGIFRDDGGGLRTRVGVLHLRFTTEGLQLKKGARGDRPPARPELRPDGRGARGAGRSQTAPVAHHPSIELSATRHAAIDLLRARGGSPGFRKHALPGREPATHASGSTETDESGQTERRKAEKSPKETLCAVFQTAEAAAAGVCRHPRGKIPAEQSSLATASTTNLRTVSHPESASPPAR